MDQDQKRQLENELVTKGLPFAVTGELIQAMAGLVSAWPGDKHRYMEDLINQCDADKRYEMYHALVPHLNFAALPLQTYEARLAERAGQMVTQRRMRVEGSRPRPIQIGDTKYIETDEGDSEAAVATLTCGCGHKQLYLSTTPAGAMKLARDAGWKRNALNKEECAVCVEKEDRARRALLTARTEWREVNIVQ